MPTFLLCFLVVVQHEGRNSSTGLSDGKALREKTILELFAAKANPTPVPSGAYSTLPRRTHNKSNRLSPTRKESGAGSGLANSELRVREDNI